MTKSKDIRTQAAALQERTEVLEREKLALEQQKATLQQEKTILVQDKEKLITEKNSLTKERDALEVREKFLATGLIASFGSLLVALLSGLFKWPNSRLDRKLTELRIEEATLLLAERKRGTHQSFRRSVA